MVMPDPPTASSDRTISPTAGRTQPIAGEQQQQDEGGDPSSDAAVRAPSDDEPGPEQDDDLDDRARVLERASDRSPDRSVGERAEAVDHPFCISWRSHGGPIIPNPIDWTRMPAIRTRGVRRRERRWPRRTRTRTAGRRSPAGCDVDSFSGTSGNVLWSRRANGEAVGDAVVRVVVAVVRRGDRPHAASCFQVRVRNTSSRLGRPAVRRRRVDAGGVDGADRRRAARVGDGADDDRAGSTVAGSSERTECGSTTAPRSGPRARRPRPARRRPRLQLGRRAGGDDAAVVEDDDVVGEAVGLLQVLRGEEHGRPVGTRSGHVPQPLRLRDRGRSSARRGTAPRGATRLAARSRRRRMPPE